MIVPKKIINDIAPLIANSDGLKIGIELSKDWPAAQYVALIEEMLISRPKTTFYLIGTLNDRIIARKIIDSIADIEIRRRCIDLSGRANMRELLALCHEFHLVVGVGEYSHTFCSNIQYFYDHTDPTKPTVLSIWTLWSWTHSRSQ